MAKYSKTSSPAVPLLLLVLYVRGTHSYVHCGSPDDESGKQVDVKPTAQRAPGPGRRVIRPP
ncbi:hypothetical protein Taro_024833 [Colocasia esculenta]|uniref:Secreted protein n=1 Tax=Colocasia esculenta TaxID=4460 RepID=A0A843V7A6_COLES|nr:hypothetical protein [Colocasia esculenta]